LLAEILLELESFKAGALRDHGCEQLAQARNIPLPAGQIEQRAAVRCLRILAEHLVEAATAREEMKRVVENQEWFGERIDDRQRKGLGLCTIVKLPHLVVLLCAGASHDSRPPARLRCR